MADIELEVDEELTLEGDPQDVTEGVHCTPSHTFREPQSAAFHSPRPNFQLFNEELSLRQSSSSNDTDQSDNNLVLPDNLQSPQDLRDLVRNWIIGMR
jgi:hypothetical protein